MTKVTLECWTRGREEYLAICLASLVSQTFTDWDMTIMEEADCNYLANPRVAGVLRLLKNKGHNIKYMHPKEMMGSVRCGREVMLKTKTKYAVKFDDDHILEPNALELLINTLENDDSIGAVGAMLYHVGVQPIDVEEIPDDFNRWTGKDGWIWNDYTTLNWRYPSQVVDVDFVRAPFMYRADLLHQTDWIDNYDKLGYPLMAHRIESEITNTIETEFNKRTTIHTGSVMWHYLSPTGGGRMTPDSMIPVADEVYYKRWQEHHNKKLAEREKK